MSDPLVFPDSSPRFALPFLFAGQAQKEFTVNELAARLDSLIACTVEASQSAPPSSPVDGQSWLVGTAPSGDWSGQAGKIAARIGGGWVFFAPPEGMTVHDRARGAIRRFSDTWQAPARPALPSGGITIDGEARTAIAAIVSTLAAAGVIPPM
jgi:Protein of unknown function (DUF2793)